MNEELMMSCFQIITYVGSARTCFINAIQSAKAGDFDGAAELLRQGDEAFVQGHTGHAELISQEAAGELPEIGLIIMHAEDQLMSAESFRIIAEEFIDMYRRLDKE